LFDEGFAELVDYPRAELAEHLHFVGAVELLHLDEMVDQQWQHLNLFVPNVCPRLGQRYQPSSIRSYLKTQYCA
jgi:hypothetical protein